MINKNIIPEILCYLEEIGWTELICRRWKNEVINDIKLKYNDIDDDTLNSILKIILV